ncbi:MAG: hypothetical protein WBW33_15150, partial [Bryobacteraceae bacterium]
ALAPSRSRLRFGPLAPSAAESDGRGCSENTYLGSLRKPAVNGALSRLGTRLQRAHGELALRRRFETLEVSMTSVRGVPDELRSAPFG